MVQLKDRLSLFAIYNRLAKMLFTTMPGISVGYCLISITHGLSWGVNTYVFQWFLDAINNAITRQGSMRTVYLAVATLGVVKIGTEVLNGVHNFASGAIIEKLRGHLGRRLNAKAAAIEAIAYEDPEFLDDINKANQGAGNSLALLIIGSTVFTFYLPYFLFMTVYLYSLKPILAFSLVLIFVPVAATQLIRSAVFTKLEDEVAPIRREYEYYERCICDREYFKETRTLGAFTFFRHLYLTALEALQRKRWTAELRTGLLELGMRMITLAGYGGVLYLLVSALLQGDISVGSFAAVFTSIGAMFSIMEEVICRHLGAMAKDLGTVRNFFGFLDLPEREGEDVQVNPGDGVAASHVSFRYPGISENALTDVSLTIDKGETIAIVGRNGAGKTTLVKLLVGLYLPSEGTVLIGGVDTKTISPRSVHQGISGVFQKYQKYQMTLRENIGISDPDFQTQSRLEEAALKADLDAAGTTFPEGFDTMLSREFDGVDLSGGQWQRVAIARGFYRVHNLIILDEPTAAIDPIEETEIYRKFAEISQGKTAIVVTHRLGSARIADRIAVMDQGQIVEVGTHDELIRAGGTYQEMYEAQAQWYVS